ncbi:hypothetical protein [Pseudoalteromonas phage PH357]|nr:hypothetical protein [Pseudoalteromonas phage PH357]
MAVTTRRAKYRENAEDSKEILEDTTVHLLDTGGGCPSLIEQAYQEALDQEARTLKMFAKAQEQVRKAIKLRLDEILESIDPKNMGKSRKVFIKNPAFNTLEERTDTDSKPCEGDNPFWTVDYEEIYNPYRFKENTILSMINLARGEGKDIVKELKEAKKKLRAAQKEAREMKEALEDVAKGGSTSQSNDEPLIDFNFEEDNTLQ